MIICWCLEIQCQQLKWHNYDRQGTSNIYQGHCCTLFMQKMPTRIMDMDDKMEFKQD